MSTDLYEIPKRNVRSAAEVEREYGIPPGRLRETFHTQGWPTISENPEIQARYEQMREAGQSHTIAEICARRSPPGAKGTEQAFLEATYNNRQFDEMPAWMAKQILQEAKAAGISTHGKVFKSGLGRHTDPKAWVSDSSDVLAVCRERNVGVTGVVNHRAHEQEPTAKPVPLAEDIIRDEAEKIVAANPDRLRDLEGVREQVINKHAYKGGE